ncbi:MAG: MtrB/PioB family outer membrane beta-barrel protein [Desulfuromusa sp.]|nr:MtrB/PioB family outer membrane beta-barrel protein [Desulfuromusa sp.]
MKQSRLWLLALLSVLTLLAATTAMAEEGAGHVTGSWELGMSGISTEDNAARVNEYSSVRAEDGVSLAPKLDLEFKNGGFILELESETMGPRDQQHGLEIDAGRVFKFESELSVLEHHKDHETLGQMGATARDDIGGSQPSVVTDKTFADLAAAGMSTTVGGASVPYDAAAAWAQEVDNNYIVTRREWKNEAELVIPALPNVTFKAGARIETREGMEQAISLAKCKACHISASGKEIDERTEEFTVGATAKFGLLTVDYEYLTRNFEEQADPESRFYVTAGGNNQLLYSNVSDTEFGKTPDSEKDAHLIKARLDLPSNTSITASYVKADIESTKAAVSDSYAFVGDNTLDSEYEGFNAKLATIIGPVRLSLRGGIYEIDGPEYELFFPARDAYTYDPSAFEDGYQEYESAESREVTDFGVDAVYRLAKATTLRLGYEYEEIERDEEELGETETHTFKAAVKTRIGKTLSGHASYEYQDIDDPFGADHATGIVQLTGTADSFDSGLVYVPTVQDASGKTLYWNDVYPARDFAATNQPDEVHEAKLSTTWSPSANMAATFFMRFRYEENGDVNYEQTTIVPGASLWYAPSDKLNLTMAYTFSNQDTENRACVGWYHG